MRRHPCVTVSPLSREVLAVLRGEHLNLQSDDNPGSAKRDIGTELDKIALVIKWTA
jgi:hypothetical protein